MAGEATKQIDKTVLWGGGRSPYSMGYGKMMMWFFLVSDALTFSGLLVAYGFIRHKVLVDWPAGEEIFRALPFLGESESYALIYVALMTFILIVSSVTMVLAVEAGHRMDKKGVMKWMYLTVIGGFFFLGSQAWEWYHFIHGSHYGVYMLSAGAHMGQWVKDLGDGTLMVLDGGTLITENIHHLMATATQHVQGANMLINEYAPDIPQYANFFFFITGFHGFHVFSGVIINIVVTIQAGKGVFQRRGHYEMIEKAGLYWHFVDLVWVFVFTFFYLV